MIKHTQTNLITTLNRTGCRRFNGVMRSEVLSHFQATEVVLFGELGVNEVVCEKRHCEYSFSTATESVMTFTGKSLRPL
jgi:hypothetical protein